VNPRLLPTLALSLPAVLAFALYLPALGFGYATVDFSMIVDRAEFHGSLADVFKSALQPAGFGTYYYRPLPLLMLGIEQQAFGGIPFPSHLVSLALFALNASMLAVLGFVVGSQLGAERGRALFIGATTGSLYALHPALIESTAWISARFDVLVTSFCLLALIADRCIKPAPKRTIAVSLLFLAAALSKEMVVGLALALPVWHSMFGTSRPRFRDRFRAYFENGSVMVYAGIAVAGIVYLVLRWQLSGHFLGEGRAQDFTVEQRVLLVLKTLGQYALLAVAPFTSNGPAHAYELPVQLSDPDVLRGIAALGLFLIMLPVTLWKSPNWPVALPCCFVITLLPVLNVVPLETIRDNYVQDRFLTLPAGFVALWAALGIASALKPGTGSRLRASLVSISVAVWMLLSALNVRATLPLWQDDLSFWSWVYARQPSSLSAGMGLQQTLLNLERFADAKRLSEDIRDRQGGVFRADQQVGYAFALGQLGEVEEGIHYMEGALAALHPSAKGKVDMFFTANAQMGVLQMLAGDLTSAEHYLRIALNQFDSSEVRFLLALTKLVAGNPEAQVALEQTLDRMSPSRASELRSTLQAKIENLRRAVETRNSASVAH